MDRLKNFIGNEYVEASGQGVTEIIDPSTGETYLEAPISNENDVDRAFAAASSAFKIWGRTTPSERSLPMPSWPEPMNSLPWRPRTRVSPFR